MECKCKNEEKKTIHQTLYDYGVQIDICRVSSQTSVKKVTFSCKQCNQERQNKICSIIENQGICTVCVKDKKNSEKMAYNTQIKDKIMEYIHNSCFSKKEIYEKMKLDLPYLSEHRFDNIINEVPHEVWIERKIDYEAILNTDKKILCYECAKPISRVKEGFVRIWKEKKVCDLCWSNHNDERNELWEFVNEWKGTEDACEICKTIRKHRDVRFQFDHLNMFDKDESICTMVSNGRSKEDIENELVLCQYLCLSCHHYITDIENRLQFTQFKKSLNKKFNDGVIDEEAYKKEREKWGVIYEKKMNEIYKTLSQEIHKKNLNEAKEICPYCYESILEDETEHSTISKIPKEWINNLKIDVSLEIYESENKYGKYTCEKCHKSVHYRCFKDHKVFQMHNRQEYKEDHETYLSDAEDLEDPLPCPNCRHENGWYRHGVGIISRRKDRSENPLHIEYQIRQKFNMTAREYINMIPSNERENLQKFIYENNQTVL